MGLSHKRERQNNEQPRSSNALVSDWSRGGAGQAAPPQPAPERSRVRARAASSHRPQSLLGTTGLNTGCGEALGKWRSCFPGAGPTPRLLVSANQRPRRAESVFRCDVNLMSCVKRSVPCVLSSLETRLRPGQRYRGGTGTTGEVPGCRAARVGQARGLHRE